MKPQDLMEMIFLQKPLSLKGNWLGELEKILREMQTENEQRKRISRILAHRFGLLGHAPKTLEQVGKIKSLHGGRTVTDGRVSQLQRIGLRLLRHPIRSRRLREFIIESSL